MHFIQLLCVGQSFVNVSTPRQFFVNKQHRSLRMSYGSEDLFKIVDRNSVTKNP